MSLLLFSFFQGFKANVKKIKKILYLCNAVYITANVSGGHLNPAVTFATCLTGHTSWNRGGLYMIAQVLGGIFGSLMGVRPAATCLHSNPSNSMTKAYSILGQCQLARSVAESVADLQQA